MGGRERLERAPDRLPQLLRERRVENVKIPPLALNDILRVVRVHHRARSVQTALFEYVMRYPAAFASRLPALRQRA